MPKGVGYGKAAKGKPAFGKAMNAKKKGKAKGANPFAGADAVANKKK